MRSLMMVMALALAAGISACGTSSRSSSTGPTTATAGANNDLQEIDTAMNILVRGYYAQGRSPTQTLTAPNCVAYRLAGYFRCEVDVTRSDLPPSAQTQHFISNLYLQSPSLVVVLRGGDCDSGSIPESCQASLANGGIVLINPADGTWHGQPPGSG